MRRYMTEFLARHETRVDPIANLKAAFAAMLGMALVGHLAMLTGLPLLIAPLGATAVLLFGQPSSPLAQPVNVMLGYLVGTIACEMAAQIFPRDLMATAVAVGSTIFLTRWLRVTHPPAGAMPILGFDSAMHGFELFVVVLIGSVTLIALALIVHRIPPRREYPLPPSEGLPDTKPEARARGQS